jgi:membrane-associated protein
MGFLHTIIDFILHIDVHLNSIITHYGTWTYGIIFLIIFCETGFVVTPFLPGDSLLFAAGAFAASGSLNVGVLLGLCWIAAVVGDNINYAIGRYLGPKVFQSDSRLLNRKYLLQAHAFYERHGGKAIILARFVPIVRTFSPFVAGVSAMRYPRFLAFDVAGGALWIGLFISAGYFFGNIPAVKKNFEVVIIAIILVSVMPMVVHWLRARRRASH